MGRHSPGPKHYSPSARGMTPKPWVRFVVLVVIIIAVAAIVIA